MLEYRPNLSFTSITNVYKGDQKIGHYEKKGPRWCFYTNSLMEYNVPDIMAQSEKELHEKIEKEYE